MKILLVNSTCKVGGVSTFMLSLRRALVAHGHACELFFFAGGSMEPLLPRDWPVHFGSLADCLRLVARARFDVVHANNVDWPNGVSAVRTLGVTLVVTAHKVREEDKTYGWTTRHCDAMTTVSDWIRRDLQPLTDVPIQVVPNGIDVHRFSPAGVGDGRPTRNVQHRTRNGEALQFNAERPIVAWIGRGGSPWKRLDRFATLAPALHRAGLRLWIVDQHGPEKVSGVFPDAVRTLQPLAEFWGSVAYEAMPDLYRCVAASGGCVVSTSEREGLPLTLLEAQACGCPVAASDVRGNNECISPRHGLLYSFEQSPEDTAAAIVGMLQDADAARMRGRDAAVYVRDAFSIGRMARHYLDIYANAPYRSSATVRSRLRARWRCSPVLHWRAYLEQRWSVGHLQLEASRELSGLGDWALSARAARASWRTSPTLFLKPSRLSRLLIAQLRGGAAAHLLLSRTRLTDPRTAETHHDEPAAHLARGFAAREESDAVRR